MIHVVRILIIIATNLAMYWRTLFYEYANDDHELVRCHCAKPKPVEGVSFQSNKKETCCEKCGLIIGKKPRDVFQNIWWHLMGMQYTNYKLAHALTLSIHTLNCVLIYLSFGRFFGQGYWLAAFLTALIYSVHPALTQGSSVWISGKGYGTAATFALLGFLFVPTAPLFYVWGMAVAAGSGILVPLVFARTRWELWVLLPAWGAVAYFLWSTRDFLFGKHASEMTLCRRLKETWGYFMTQTKVKNYIGWRWQVMEDRTYHKPLEWCNIILAFKTYGYYARLCLFPVRLGIHHSFLEGYGATPEEKEAGLKLDKDFYLGVFVVCFVLSKFLVRYDPGAFGLWWWFVTLLPWSNIVIGGMFIAERYCTIPVIGLMWAVVVWILSLPGPVAIALYGPLMTYYATRTQFHLPFYRNFLTCLDYNILNFPNGLLAWYWKGGMEKRMGLWYRAFDSWFRAWQIRPFDFRLNYDLAAICMHIGNFKRAQEFLDLAKQAPLKGREAERDKMTALFQAKIETTINLKQAEVHPGRNSPCRCGSGKKFKRCHGKE